MEFNISGEINNVDEFMQFQRILHKELYSRMFSQKNIIITILLFSIYIFQDLIREFSFQKIIIYILVIGIPCIIILLAAYSKVINRKSFEEYKLITGNLYFIINENNIIMNCQKGIENINKNDIRKILFDNDSIYIIPKSTFGGIIKKRFFDNEEKYNELVLFLKEKYIENI